MALARDVCDCVWSLRTDSLGSTVLGAAFRATLSSVLLLGDA